MALNAKHLAGAMGRWPAAALAGGDVEVCRHRAIRRNACQVDVDGLNARDADWHALEGEPKSVQCEIDDEKEDQDET